MWASFFKTICIRAFHTLRPFDWKSMERNRLLIYNHATTVLTHTASVVFLHFHSFFQTISTSCDPEVVSRTNKSPRAKDEEGHKLGLAWPSSPMDFVCRKFSLAQSKVLIDLVSCDCKRRIMRNKYIVQKSKYTNSNARRMREDKRKTDHFIVLGMGTARADEYVTSEVFLAWTNICSSSTSSIYIYTHTHYSHRYTQNHM